MNPTLILSSGSDTTWANVSASSVVSASIDIIIRVDNTSDSPLDFYYRKTGETAYPPVSILEGRSEYVVISLDASATFDYYISNGTIDIYVSQDFGLTSGGVGTGYCTTTELVNISGSNYSSSFLQAIIDQADREINSRLALAEISAPSSDAKLKTASLMLSMAGVFTRMRIDGSNPNTLRIGDVSTSDDIDTAISALIVRAWQNVDSYILTHGSEIRSRWYLRKVNG